MIDDPYIHTLRQGNELTGLDMVMLEKLSDGINKMREEIAELKAINAQLWEALPPEKPHKLNLLWRDAK